jgi:hypothetical protein
MQYLWQTRHEGLLIRKLINNDIVIYVDASYGGEDSKSQTGVVITIGR